jgi:hypothetical protein
MDNTQKELELIKENKKKIQDDKIRSGDSEAWLRAALETAMGVGAAALPIAIGITGIPALAMTIGVTAVSTATMNYFFGGDDLSTAIKKGAISGGVTGLGILGVNFLAKGIGKVVNIFKPGSYTGDASKTMMPYLEKTLTPTAQVAVLKTIKPNEAPKTHTPEATKNSISKNQNLIAFYENSSNNSFKNPLAQELIKFRDETSTKTNDSYQVLKKVLAKEGMYIPETYEDYQTKGSVELTNYIARANSQIEPSYTGTFEEIKNKILENRKPIIGEFQGEAQELQEQNKSLQKQNQDIANKERQMQERIYDYNNYLADNNNGITADQLKRFSEEDFGRRNQLKIAPEETKEILQKIINSPATSNIEKAKFELFGGEEPKISLAVIDNIATGNSKLTEGSQLNDAFQDLAHTILQEKLPEEHKPAYEYIFKERKPNQEIVSENEKIITNNEKTIANNKNKIQDLLEITDKDVKNTLALEEKLFDINSKTQKEKENLAYRQETLNNFLKNEKQLKEDNLKIASEKKKDLSDSSKSKYANGEKLAKSQDAQSEQTNKNDISVAKIKDENAQTELNNETNKKKEEGLKALLEKSEANEETNRENTRKAEEEAKAKERNNTLLSFMAKAAPGSLLGAMLNKFLFPEKQEQE